MKELRQIDGIQSVSKGRYFLSPGLAPTFQVKLIKLIIKASIKLVDFCLIDLELLILSYIFYYGQIYVVLNC